MSMEGFSAEQIAHAGAISLDLHVRGPLHQLGIQVKPLVRIMEGKKKTFTAAKENITFGVKMERGAGGVNDGLKGYSHTQTVGFYNPGNGLRASYVWREHHMGYTLSETELKTQGILVGDEFGSVKRNSGDKGLVVLANILDEANRDFDERYAESANTLYWGDGTSDASALHGVRAFIRDVPTIGTVGGLSAVSHTKWRNRSRTAAFFAHASFNAANGGNRVTSSASNGGALLHELDVELMQLRRYGARPNVALAGSDFIEAMNLEKRANGQYYQGSGEMKDGMDTAIPSSTHGGIKFEYDPTLDDLGRTKYAYIWDSNHIFLNALEGDWKRVRNPARPYNQFVMHKSLTCTGNVMAKQLDGALVIEIA